jgi:excisionase family DNA binding protein
MAKDAWDPLVSRAEAARLLGVKVGTLEVWASTGRYDLPFVKVGRLVRYRMSDLEAFIRRRRRTAGCEH